MKTILASLVLSLGCGAAWAVKPTSASTAADPVAHPATSHTHNEKCGHTAVKHNTHTDYVDNGEFHAQHANHYDHHGLVTTGATAPGKVAAKHMATTDEKGHKHGDNCGHEKVQHGDHFDFVHDGHYHAVHADHTDEHGNI